MQLQKTNNPEKDKQSLNKNKLRTLLSGFTVAFAIMLFTILFGIANGFQNTFENYIKKYQSTSINDRLKTMIDDILGAGHIQKDDLTIVAIDGK